MSQIPQFYLTLIVNGNTYQSGGFISPGTTKTTVGLNIPDQGITASLFVNIGGDLSLHLKSTEVPSNSQTPLFTPVKWRALVANGPLTWEASGEVPLPEGGVTTVRVDSP